MLEKFVNFLNRSPTTYHAAQEIKSHLLKARFTPLKEGDKWEL
jgi:aspartyl aminopeptidase